MKKSDIFFIIITLLWIGQLLAFSITGFENGDDKNNDLFVLCEENYQWFFKLKQPFSCITNIFFIIYAYLRTRRLYNITSLNIKYIFITSISINTLLGFGSLFYHQSNNSLCSGYVDMSLVFIILGHSFYSSVYRGESIITFVIFNANNAVVSVSFIIISTFDEQKKLGFLIVYSTLVSVFCIFYRTFKLKKLEDGWVVNFILIIIISLVWLINLLSTDDCKWGFVTHGMSHIIVSTLHYNFDLFLEKCFKENKSINRQLSKQNSQIPLPSPSYNEPNFVPAEGYGMDGITGMTDYMVAP